MNNEKIEEMSLCEKRICRKILGRSARLPYPTRLTSCSDGTKQEEYVIPEEERQKVLEELFFLRPIPTLDERMFDIHENAFFIMREFRVIRWRGTNILCSPYFDRSGGTAIDLFREEQYEQLGKTHVAMNIIEKK